MSYHTPSAPCQAVYEIKKSEFLAFAYPINSREMLMFHVEQLKQQYPDARHVCYGYIIGHPKNTTAAGFDDDGEPSGTAGKPILNVLLHKNIGDVAVCVVRYFGGIKLGAGGLVRAYATATQMVVEQMTLTLHLPTLAYQIHTSFAHEQKVRHLIETHQGSLQEVLYEQDVALKVSLPQHHFESFVEALSIFGTIEPVS